MVKSVAKKAPAKKAAAPAVKATKATAKSVPAKKTTARKRTPAKKAAGVRKKASTTSTKTADGATSTRSPRRREGPVERATRLELERAKLHTSPLAASAIRMAHHVDEADGAQAAAAAARELRLTLATAYSVGNPLSPPGAGEDPDSEGVVVGQDRLEEARRRSASARQGKKSAR